MELEEDNEDSPISRLSYADLRKEAKKHGLKANGKADVLRKELRRVSFAAGTTPQANAPMPRTFPVTPGVAKVSFDSPQLPSKTPAFVSKRRRAPRGPQEETLAEETLLDPISVANSTPLPTTACASTPLPNSRTVSAAASITTPPPLEDFFSDDDDGSTRKKVKCDSLSQYMSEEEEDEKPEKLLTRKTMADPLANNRRSTTLISNTRASIPPVNGDTTPGLERQKTFELDSPSTENRPPLARERTFEMESPSDGVRPPLARQRTFDALEDSVKAEEIAIAPSSPKTNVPTAIATPAIADLVAEDDEFVFNVSNRVDLSGLNLSVGPSDEEIRAQILASIAVTPSALAAAKAASKTKIIDSSSKSLTKDWHKIHSKGVKQMESLVDFYERKQRRLEELQKSNGKGVLTSAAKAAGAQGPKANTPKMKRALSFKAGVAASTHSVKADSNPSASTSNDLIVHKGSTSMEPRRVQPNKRARTTSTAVTTKVSAPAAKRAKFGGAKASSTDGTKSAPPLSQPVAGLADQIKIPKLFKPTVFSTKNANFNFGAALAFTKKAETSQPPDAVSKALSSSGAPDTPTRPQMKGSATQQRKQQKPVRPGSKAFAAKGKPTNNKPMLPSMPRMADPPRRLSPRLNKADNIPSNNNTSNKANIVANNPQDVNTASSSNRPATPKSTPMRLAPSRVTTPGSRRILTSAGRQPASVSRSGSAQSTPNRKSPWIPSGVTGAPGCGLKLTPSFNFAANNAANNAENVFRFDAKPTSASSHPVKKFDLKESLKHKLKYRPHRGALKPFNDPNANLSKASRGPKK